MSAAEGRAVDRAALAAHLVDALVSDHAGLPYAAGRDLLHHEEVYAEFDDEQRARIAAALRTDRKPDRDAAGLAVAAGRIGGDDVVDALVDRLRAGDWRQVTGDRLLRAGMRATIWIADVLCAQKTCG